MLMNGGEAMASVFSKPWNDDDDREASLADSIITGPALTYRDWANNAKAW